MLPPDPANASYRPIVYHLLVEDGSGSFMGMLSVSDLLRVIANDEKVRADLLTAMVFESR